MLGWVHRCEWLCCGLLVAALGSCGDPGDPVLSGGVGGPAADPPGVSPAATQNGAGAQSSPVQIRLEPKFVDASDMKLGEVRTYRVAVLLEKGDELPSLRAASTCNCLSGTILEQTQSAAVLEVVVEGSEKEDIDGGILVEDSSGRQLGEHVVRLFVTPGMFVMPREVELTPDTTSFEIAVCAGVDPRDEPPTITLGPDSTIFGDDPRFSLLSWDVSNELTEHYRLVKNVFPFQLSESAFAEDGEVVMSIQVEEPEAKEFKVTVRWKAAR